MKEANKLKNGRKEGEKERRRMKEGMNEVRKMKNGRKEGKKEEREK